jgi:hypothetical protein
MGRWVSHELIGPGHRFAWTLLLAVTALALSAYAGRRATRTAGLEPAVRRRQLRRRRALAQRHRRVTVRTARRRRRTGRRLRRRRAVQARLHLEIEHLEIEHLEIDLRDASTGPDGLVAHERPGPVSASNGTHPPNGAALPPVDIAIDISVDVAADLAVGNLPPLPVVYESEITLESGETLECGIVAAFRTR